MKELQNFNSSNNKKVLVALPVNRIEDFLLNECLYSLAQQESPIDVLILANNLTPEDRNRLEIIATGPIINIQEKNDKNEIVKKQISALKDLNFIIEDTNADTFSKVFNEGFNYAVKNNYEWYSMVEYDDIVDVRWFTQFENYHKSKPEIHGFAPITREVSNGAFLGYINEACWVENMAEIAGIFDWNLLTKWNCMNITGTVLNVEKLKEYSEQKQDTELYKPLKESLKIDYIYEFFLRLTYNDFKIYTIPRLGYEHRIDRPSQVVDYFTSKLPRDIVGRAIDKGGMTPDEFNFWKSIPKKEQYHIKDRNTVYAEPVQ